MFENAIFSALARSLPVKITIGFWVTDDLSTSTHSGVPICKSCSDQLITLGQYGYMNSKSLTVFLFPFLIYLPFLFREKLFQLSYPN